MSVTGISINPYDEVPFPSQPLTHSLPDRLAAVGRLFGLPSPAAERCRVLELGCATGGNIIPMAERFPESEFVGIDYSRAQLLTAERLAGQLQLSNLKLQFGDIAELGNSLGTFDYIICHGVYSWVSAELQDKILELCRSSLSPHGIAYISYNVFPSWHLRMVVRDVLCRFVEGTEGPKARCAQGRAVLEFLAKAAGDEPTAYAKLLKAEAESILRLPDGYIYHEYFESDNRPLYFHEFVSQISRFDLQYLGEAAPATMFSSNFGSRIDSHLKGLAFDLIAGEQHLDLLRNRGFRQTLVCHSNVQLSRHITSQNIADLRFFGRVEPQNPAIDLRAPGSETFVAASHMTISTSAPALKAALYYLNQQWPRAFTADELLAVAVTLVGRHEGAIQLPPQARDVLGQNLANCVANGLLEITTSPDGFIKTISERPLTGRLARIEAHAGNRITNRRHELIDVDDATRNLLPYLDGRHDRKSLLQELVEAVERGDVSILVGGLPAPRGDKLVHLLELTLNQSLQKLASNALLIA
jgi:methyltransferase-like protein/ubiquinone/menaquinone biosynthesis C-methylase UbiE